METITISDNLMVEIAVDNYGKCFRLHQNRKTISLGSGAYTSLIRHTTMLNVMMDNRVDRGVYSLALSNRKSVGTMKDRGERYIKFSERPRYDENGNSINDRARDKAIILTYDDWKILNKQFEYLTSLMNEGTIVYSTSDGVWHLNQGAAALDGAPGPMIRTVLPRLCQKQITVRLYAHLIREAVKYVDDEVYGNEQPLPIFQAWRHSVTSQFQTLKQKVDTNSALEELRKQTKWHLPFYIKVEDDFLLELVVDRHKEISCHCCADRRKELAEMYDRLFSFLLL